MARQINLDRQTHLGRQTEKIWVDRQMNFFSQQTNLSSQKDNFIQLDRQIMYVDRQT